MSGEGKPGARDLAHRLMHCKGMQTSGGRPCPCDDRCNRATVLIGEFVHEATASLRAELNAARASLALVKTREEDMRDLVYRASCLSSILGDKHLAEDCREFLFPKDYPPTPTPDPAEAMRARCEGIVWAASTTAHERCQHDVELALAVVAGNIAALKAPGTQGGGR